MLSKKYKIFYLVGLITFILDHASKYWASKFPSRGWQSSVSHRKLLGLAYGMELRQCVQYVFGLRVRPYFLNDFGLVALVGVFWMVKQTNHKQTLSHWAFGLVLGGAIGNIADRIYFGKVTDFIVWRYYDKEWPTFNVADIALCIGIVLILIDSRNADKKPEKASK